VIERQYLPTFRARFTRRGALGTLQFSQKTFDVLLQLLANISFSGKNWQLYK